MIDRLFTSVLAFSMLAFGAASFASFAMEAPVVEARQVQLERVVITAKRIAPVAVAQADAQGARAIAVQ